MINTEEMTESIKVNFPATEQDYQRGNGEGMWVLVTPETKKAYDTDATGGSYFGVLDNPSLYYPGLGCGDIVHFEMRGESRPVADFYGFLSKLPVRITPEGMMMLIQEIAEKHGESLS